MPTADEPAPRSGRQASAHHAPPDAFRILFVCTGNIHRSPMARSCLLALAHPDAPIEVTSAGTRAVVGAAMADSSVAALRSLGVPTAPHAARQLRPEFVEQADLILTAEEIHAHTILEATPTALRRTFALLEFVRISDGVAALRPGSSPADLRQHVLTIAGRRGIAPRALQTEDISDPVSSGQRRTTAIAGEIRACVQIVATSFGL